jgi:hypothetical protein
MKSLFFITLALLFPLAASAVEPGHLELRAIVSLFGSPLGFAVGLLVTAVGVWQFIVGQNISRGIILIILGVVVTGFPTLYSGLRKDFYMVPAGMGGSGEAGAFDEYIGK